MLLKVFEIGDRENHQGFTTPEVCVYYESFSWTVVKRAVSMLLCHASAFCSANVMYVQWLGLGNTGHRQDILGRTKTFRPAGAVPALPLIDCIYVY